SALFLACYLVYHAQVGSVPFPRQGAVRTIYFTILITHVLLAFTVPPLAIVTLSRGLKARYPQHRKIARWTFPIWLYVSVTRVLCDGEKRTVVDGPFAETKELIAGFWIWKVKSKNEAIEWLKRAPFGGGTEVEIRQIFEAEDFGANLTPELRAQEERNRDAAAALAKQ